MDVISVETEEGAEYVQKRYSQYSEKMFFMPNGMNIERMYQLAPLRVFEQKENIILTVGRIGSPEKNNEMLLLALEKLDFGEWKAVFIGPIEKRFQPMIDDFFQRNGHLKESVIFTGAIYDRQVLFDWYARSKIFCLTSIEESFGFVLIEAMAYANYVVTTPISSANEITDCGQCGTIVSGETELSEQLRVLIEGSNQVEGIANLAKERTFSRYDWKTILLTLNNFIEKKQRL
jgi:glycosyltransferase involved in cell wall biosynthesis